MGYESEAQQALTDYLDAWWRRDWPGMVCWTQFTWRKEQTDAGRWLREVHEHKLLKSYAITDAAPLSESPWMVDVACLLHYERNTVLQSRRITARVVHETQAYTPVQTLSIRGLWGVNPISTLYEVPA